MATINLQVEQYDIIRRVLTIEDANLLTRIKNFISENAPTNDDYRPKTKAEVMTELRNCCMVIARQVLSVGINTVLSRAGRLFL